MERIDPILTDRARRMRREPTPMEHVLWQKLRRSQLGGLKLRRQSVRGRAIPDFVCPDIGLLIEIDGDTHDAEQDARRDARFAQDGYTVIRFINSEVLGNLYGVLEAIVLRARGLSQRRYRSGPTHPPAPSLGREGEL